MNKKMLRSLKRIRAVLGKKVTHEDFSNYCVYISDDYVAIEDEKRGLRVVAHRLFNNPEIEITFNPEIVYPNEADIVSFLRGASMVVSRIGNKKASKGVK